MTPATIGREVELATIHGAGSSAPGGAGGADLVQAITVLRARVDEEFRISERLESKARQAFALTAGFFAVVQTIALGGLAQDMVHTAERVWLLAAALCAGVALLVVAHRLVNGAELLEEADVKPDAVVEWCNKATDPEYVSVRLVAELARMANRRTENNEIRAIHYDRVAYAARWAIIFALLELLTAIVVRL